MGKGCCVYRYFNKLFMIPAVTVDEHENIGCNAGRHYGAAFVKVALMLTVTRTEKTEIYQYNIQG